MQISSISLDTPAGTLHGTLLVPPASAPMPLAVIISGSGPTDRDGNSTLLPSPNDSLKLLAEGLAAHGIASLRYDKRGIGESRAAMTSEADLRLGMYADDAAGWVNELRADPRFSTVTIIGHSEGSLLGMMAVHQAPIDGFVSLAGAGRPADQILREQLGKQLPPPLLIAANAALDTLLAGHTIPDPPPELAALFRPSVQAYMISWLAIDPRTEIARLDIPVLIVQGTLDLQVSQSDADALARAQPNAKVQIIDGMTHILKRVAPGEETQLKSYTDASLPVVPELIDGIASFVKSVPRHAPPTH